jgi:hypothetical protein
MKYAIYGILAAVVGAILGWPVGLSFAPESRIAHDGTSTWVCGNEYGEPGMLIGLITGLLLGLILARRSSARPGPPITNT